jgi:hypothetical protein
MKKYFLAFSFVFLAAACQTKQVQTTTNVNTNSVKPVPTEVTNSKNIVYAEWVLKDMPPGKYDEPFTKVSLKLTGAMTQEIDLGTYANCKTDSPENGNILALSCWWAGAGDDLFVKTQSGGQLLVINQPTGELPEGALPLKPKTLKTISLPKDAEVIAK